MAGFAQASRRTLLMCCRTLVNRRQHQFSCQPNRFDSNFLARFSRTHTSSALQKSPFESNILRILRTEMEYQSEYAPPQPPTTRFDKFTVEDRPGELWITLRGKSAENETVKIEATMFDGSALDSKNGEDGTEEDVRLHISLLVDIFKEEGGDMLEFVCSSWPDCLEIQKVYVYKDGGLQSRPYLGPKFRDLDKKLQSAFYQFLKARGVTDHLSVFLHEFMLNKDRTELITWFGKLKSFLEI